MTRESGPVTDRRSLLHLGSSTLAAVVAGCQWHANDGGTETSRDPPSETASDGEQSPEPTPPTAYTDRFETVVDVVADAGANPDAEEPINALLEDHAGDDTLLYFPPGRYLMDDIWLYDSFTDLGLVGDDATIVPKQGYNDYLFVLGLPGKGASGLLFEGFDFDFRATETHPRPVQVQIADDFVVRDVTARGSSGTARFDVTTDQGSGLVSNLSLPDGGMEPNPVGVLVGPENVGTVTFENCHVEGFPGNGLYASPSNGPVNVSGGYYANSGIANVRVSGPTVVRGVHVRCDRAPDGFRNMRGIRLRHGESALVENCTVEMREVTYSEGALVVEPLMESPTIRNLDVELSADDVMAINAKTPMDTVAKPAIDCEDVTVTGSARKGSAIRVVDRDDCRFTGVDVEQTGPDRDGFYFVRSSGNVLDDVTLDVTGDPIVLEQSDVEKRDVATEATTDEE